MKLEQRTPTRDTDDRVAVGEKVVMILKWSSADMYGTIVYVTDEVIVLDEDNSGPIQRWYLNNDIAGWRRAT